MMIEERITTIELLIKKLFEKTLPGVSFPGETWVPVRGFEDFYEVSDEGRIKKASGKILKQTTGSHGYPLIRLQMHGQSKVWYVHGIVARSFLGECPEGHEVDHVNSNRGDASLRNLEYVTHAENIRRASARGRMCRGERQINSKLTDESVREIRSADCGLSNSEAAKKYGVSISTIYLARKRITWRHVI